MTRWGRETLFSGFSSLGIRGLSLIDDSENSVRSRSRCSTSAARMVSEVEGGDRCPFLDKRSNSCSGEDLHRGARIHGTDRLGPSVVATAVFREEGAGRGDGHLQGTQRGVQLLEDVSHAVVPPTHRILSRDLDDLSIRGEGREGLTDSGGAEGCRLVRMGLTGWPWLRILGGDMVLWNRGKDYIHPGGLTVETTSLRDMVSRRATPSLPISGLIATAAFKDDWLLLPKERRPSGEVSGSVISFLSS